jgi:hypothetical protein
LTIIACCFLFDSPGFNHFATNSLSMSKEII